MYDMLENVFMKGRGASLRSPPTGARYLALSA